MNERELTRPIWAEKLRYFITDDMIDFLALGPSSEPFVGDEIGAIVLAWLCERYGHYIMDDVCGNPEHRLCAYCHALFPNAEVTA